MLANYLKSPEYMTSFCCAKRRCLPPRLVPGSVGVELGRRKGGSSVYISFISVSGRRNVVGGIPVFID